MGQVMLLFLCFLQIGACSIGGGYAIIPMIRERVVETAGWLTQDTFMNIITISQMTPGPLAVNTSTFVGIKTAGIAGGAAATLGCVAPGVLIALLVGQLFNKYQHSEVMQTVRRGLKSASLGLIMAAGATLMQTAFAGVQDGTLNWKACAVFAVCMLLQRRVKINPILLMALTGAAGLLLYSGFQGSLG